MLKKPIQNHGRPWVLVIEDDLDVRDALLLLIQDQGVAALGAANGLEAIKIIMGAVRHDHMPFLFFTDLEMPIISGQELLEIKEVAQPKIKNIPVVVTSGALLPSALVAPNVKLLKKPYTIEQIIDEINVTLKKRGKDQ